MRTPSRATGWPCRCGSTSLALSPARTPTAGERLARRGADPTRRPEREVRADLELLVDGPALVRASPAGRTAASTDDAAVGRLHGPEHLALAVPARAAGRWSPSTGPTAASRELVMRRYPREARARRPRRAGRPRGRAAGCSAGSRPRTPCAWSCGRRAPARCSPPRSASRTTTPEPRPPDRDGGRPRAARVARPQGRGRGRASSARTARPSASTRTDRAAHRAASSRSRSPPTSAPSRRPPPVPSEQLAGPAVGRQGGRRQAARHRRHRPAAAARPRRRRGRRLADRTATPGRHDHASTAVHPRRRLDPGGALHDHTRAPHDEAVATIARLLDEVVGDDSCSTSRSARRPRSTTTSSWRASSSSRSPSSSSSRYGRRGRLRRLDRRHGARPDHRPHRRATARGQFTRDCGLAVARRAAASASTCRSSARGRPS